MKKVTLKDIVDHSSGNIYVFLYKDDPINPVSIHCVNPDEFSAFVMAAIREGFIVKCFD